MTAPKVTPKMLDEAWRVYERFADGATFTEWLPAVYVAMLAAPAEANRG